MSNYGLTKLIEECGELTAVVAKLIAYPDGIHPDGKGDLYRRMEDEMGDVLAGLRFVAAKFPGINIDRAAKRADEKVELYLKWDKE